MAAQISIPDFPYSSHFYPEILEDLISFMRANVPELTDEDPTEPHVQLLRAFALSAHLNNVLLDLVANEMFLPTAKLRSSHRNLLALIDVKLRQPSPASADVLIQLTRTFSSLVTTVPAKSLFATLETRAASAVEFEVLDDYTLTMRTDLVGKVYAYDGSSYTDHSAEAQTPSGTFTFGWGTVSAGDTLYIGHPDVMWNKIKFNMAAPITGGLITGGVWEYHETNLDQENPTSVTNLGSTLRFNVNSILGTADRSGAVVRVRSNTTGAYQDLVSTFSGGENRIETTGTDAFLGQSTPSTSVTDYTVGAEWRSPEWLADETADFGNVGEKYVSFTLPQSLKRNWTPASVGTGVLAFTAYWIRYRVISVSGTPTSPAAFEVTISDGDQFQSIGVTQGKSQEDNPLGSSDGSANQQFILAGFPVIDDDNLKVYVDEGVEKEYTRVDNFLNSTPTDRHFTVSFDDDGIATISFSDGINGKIPPSGVNNIRAEYRTMDEVDGNVGSDTITVNRSGIAHISNPTNPRGASGYSPKEGSTDADLARLKVAGPASLRVRDRAVSPEDCETVAADFVASDGSSPVKRALAIEEAFGPKTVEIVVVGAGGAQVTASKLQEIQDYFNGTADVRGKLLLNMQAIVTNFTLKSVDVTATVDGGNLVAILTALTALLNPLYVDEDGVFLWQFGCSVPLARIIQEIMNTDPHPRNVTITTPASDVLLGSHELPVVGTLAITVT